MPASWPAPQAPPLNTTARIKDCGWSATVEPGGQWSYTSFVGAVEEITGRPADYFLGGTQRWGGIVHPEDRADWDQAFVRLLRERCAQSEYRVIRPDESVRWVHETIQVVGDGERRMGYCGTVTDITDCKHSAIASRLLRTLTLAIAEAANVEEALRLGLGEVCAATGWLVGQAWIPAIDNSCLECSPAYYAGADGLDGYRSRSAALRFLPGEGLVGKVWSTKQPWWIRDVTRDTTFARVGLARQFGLRSAFALPILAGDRVLAVLSFLAREARAEDRHLLELISGVAAQLGGFLQRKQVEEELLRERHLLHVLMDSVPDGIYFKDASSRFLRVNRSVAGRFGLLPDEVAGKTDADFF
ncbi:MAG: PAS domain-containing protein, partial [Gemmataceae bacterium]